MLLDNEFDHLTYGLYLVQLLQEAYPKVITKL